jgi:hypothetical protein
MSEQRQDDILLIGITRSDAEYLVACIRFASEIYGQDIENGAPDKDMLDALERVAKRLNKAIG